MRGQASNCRPARLVSRVTGVAAVAASRWWCRVAVRTAACGRQRTPARGPCGLGKCLGTATCVHDPARGEPPGGRQGCRSTLAGEPTSGVVHGTPAGRTRESATKLLLRDHAPPQLRGSSVLAAKMGRADGAYAAPRRAGFWPHRPGVVAPADAPPASGGPGAGIRGPGSNAGSNAAAGTCAHSLCAGRSAPAVVADWYGGGTLDYHDGSPRERRSPKGQPGGNALSFSSGANRNRQTDGRSPV
jgi:hypothetical protein